MSEITKNKDENRQSWLKKLFKIQEVNVVLPLLALVIIATLINPGFWEGANIPIILRRMAMWGFVAIGETLIILVGEIDISVGAMTAFVGVFFSILMANFGWPLYLAIAAVVLSAMALSMFSGFCIVKLKISAFITTIAMQFICLGAAKALTDARPVSLLKTEGAQGLIQFGQSEPLGLSWGFFMFALLIIAGQIMLKRTAFGRQIYATGDNKNAARLAGVRVDFVKIAVFAISGVLVGIAGVMLIGKEAVGNANNADGWELLAIAAAAIGGISLVGGAGSMIGAFIGMVMMQVISNILILLDVNQHMQSVLLGIFLIASVFMDIRRRNKLLGKLD